MAHVLIWDGVDFAEMAEKTATDKAAKGELHAYLRGEWVCEKDGQNVYYLQDQDFYGVAPKRRASTKRRSSKPEEAAEVTEDGDKSDD